MNYLAQNDLVHSHMAAGYHLLDEPICGKVVVDLTRHIENTKAIGNLAQAQKTLWQNYNYLIIIFILVINRNNLNEYSP